MRGHSRLFLLAAALASAATASGLRAQEPFCDRLAVAETAARKVYLEAHPPSAPNPDAAKQIQASSGSQAAAGPVDNPSLVGLLGVALDNDLVEFGEGKAVTVSLSPFAFATALTPGLLDDQRLYEEMEWMRRIEGSLTLGGKGDTFDRNGDGKPDPPPDVENASDSVAWEVRLRLFGSRDRRDRSFQEAAARASLRFQSEVATYSDFVTAHFGPGVSCKAFAEKVKSSDAVRKELLALAEASIATEKALADAVVDLDRRFILTAFASGVRREDVLGPDKTTFGLRAGWGKGFLDHTFNFDWSQEEEDAAGRKPRFIKLGYAATSRPAPQRSFDPKLSLFAAWERYEDIPDAKHDTVAKVGGKVEITLAQGVRVPLTVTWANHRDLIEDADEFIGHVGVSVDLGDLRKAAK